MPKNNIASKTPSPTRNAPDDDASPPTKNAACTVVGVGASAGGLEAFSQLLRAMPADTGMAFVLVQHLAPTHTSILAEILSRETSMPVTEVGADPKAELKVEANNVYVIPPNQAMTIAHGKLHLFEREAKGQPRVIDQFFSSLAEDQGHLSIGVILSGTATDGTLGLEEIKAAGGITFAQDNSAQFDGMPRSAIDSGCIDYELPPAKIAAEIAHIAAHPCVAFDDNEDGDSTTQRKSDIAPILSVLQDATGVDFNRYQPNTLNRRIKRRMILAKANGLKDYLRMLREKPHEVQALYQDVLINVTSFFRDPDTFEALRTVMMPKMFKGRSANDPLRIWVVGCSTGEEAYSLAMLFTEVAESTKSLVRAQIFATDLSAANVDKARAGLYSKQRLQDMQIERIPRFFVEENGMYRVSKSIREMCVFAKHNVITDPPFSRMDLVSCRNLLIYLKPAMQQRVLRTLHFSLTPNGCLVLGSSETVAQTREIFGVLDAKHKIFCKSPGVSQQQPVIESKRTNHKNGAKVPPDQSLEIDSSGPGDKYNGLDVHREAERLLLARFAPPGVLVNQDLDILQFRGETDPYLAPAPGKASLSLLKMAREGLLVPIRAAIQRAKKENGPIREDRIQFKSAHGPKEIRLEVVPVKGRSAAEGGFLVLFEEDVPASKPEEPKTISHGFEEETSEAQIARIEQELAATREYLQSVIEQEEATNEELQSANEEAQSSNEELQSINEELETSKEEIQSSNEELVTVNDELQNRNLEVSQVNNDLVNLIGSVNTAIVMVGLDLTIRRFSPVAEKLLNVIPSDIGRPITNIRMNFEVPNLDALLLEVINTISPRELEVQDSHGHWFSLRIRPYVTLEKKIEGAVMMLVDVDGIRRSRDYAESIVQTVRQPLVILDDNLSVKTANRAFYETFKVAFENVEERPFFEVGGERWEAPKLRRLILNVVSKGDAFENLQVERKIAGVGQRIMLFSGRRLTPPGSAALILLAIEDVTQPKLDEAKLASKEQQYRETLETSVAERTAELGSAIRELEGFNYTVAHDLRTPLRAIIFNSTTLLEELGDSLSEDQRSMLKAQARNAKRLAALIDDLLKFSRLSRLPVARKSVDVTELAEKVAEELSHASTPCGCRFDIQRGITCKADETLFRMVIGNLIENACKFSPHGGTISVGSFLDDGGTTYFVKDEGIGFDMAYAEQVFMPFERLHLIEEYPGTGIGLATVKRIVERHGGQIRVESQSGKGSTFFFTMSPDGTKPSRKIGKRPSALAGE